MEGPNRYYKYGQLPAGRIRLLRIQHTSPKLTAERRRVSSYPFEQQLAVQLETFESDQCPPYMALSYTWGLPGSLEDPEPSVFTQVERVYPIYCENSILLATWNLRSALRSLRLNMEVQHNTIRVTNDGLDHIIKRFGGAIYLWVDALCIDQNNLDERALHVRAMGKIYAQASRTFLWLGVEDEHTPKVFKTLTRLQVYLNKIGPENGTERVVLDQSELSACIALFSRHWFSRNWVSQEVINAKDVIVSVGQKIFSFETFERASSLVQIGRYRSSAHAIGYETSRINAAHSAVRFLTYVENARHMVRAGHLPDFLTLINTCEYQNCSDPRDKIYSILGVCAEFNSTAGNSITVSYTAGVEDCYIHATQTVIQARHDLFVLNFASREDSPSKLPSWCPDYRAIHPSIVGRLDLRKVWQFPQAQARHQVCCIKGHTLLVLGQCIGKVQESTRLHPKGVMWSSAGPASMCSLLTRITRPSHDHLSIRLQNFTRVELLWRTMLSQFDSLFTDLVGECGETLPSGAGLLLPIFLRSMTWWHLTLSDVSTDSIDLSVFTTYMHTLESSISKLLLLEPENEILLPKANQLRKMCWPLHKDTQLFNKDALGDVAVAAVKMLDNEQGKWRELALTSNLELPESFLNSSTDAIFSEFADNGLQKGANRLLGFADGLTRSPMNIFRTDSQLLGLTSCKLTPKDEVWILDGAHAPILLRDLGNGKYRFLTEAYMYGLMDGEAIPFCEDPTSISIQ